MKAKFAQHPRFTVSLFGLLALALVAFLASCDSRDETPIAAATSTAEASNGMQLAGEFVQAQSGVFYCQKNESAAGFDLSCQAVDPTAEPTGEATEEPTEEAPPTLAATGTSVPAATATATPRVRGTATSTPALPTTEPTGLPSPTAEVTPTAEGTAQATATAAATPTELPPGAHDTDPCHTGETGDGHSHGLCWQDLPEGRIKDFVAANPMYQMVHQPWHSSPIENSYPQPGHVGHAWLFFGPYTTCHQFTNVEAAGNGLCLRALYYRTHSTRIAEELYKPSFSRHSEAWVAEVCLPDMQTCGIAASGGIPPYMEVHAKYKETYCGGLDGLVRYAPQYTVEQPPYVASNFGRNQDRPGEFFWSSLTNTLMQNQLRQYFDGRDINAFYQAAWLENVWERPSPVTELCGFPEHDVLICTRSEDCDIMRFWLFTFKIELEDLPRVPGQDYRAFNDSLGNPLPACTQPGPLPDGSESCVPVFVSADVPPNEDLFFNRPVMPASTEFVDYNEPGLVMPGTE